MMTIKPIVVGIDGSDSALQAVRWAAREAASRKAPLRLVHAYLLISAYTPVSLPLTMAEVMAEKGRKSLRAAEQVAREEAPQVEVSTHLERDDPTIALIAESTAARLMVLGSRGLGGFTGLMVGSVAVKVVQHASCPVVVARGDDEDSGGRQIVVGVDGSPAGEAAHGRGLGGRAHVE
jgi:nucleotide-binding universal stress UspA family protein